MSALSAPEYVEEAARIADALEYLRADGWGTEEAPRLAEIADLFELVASERDGVIGLLEHREGTRGGGMTSLYGPAPRSGANAAHGGTALSCFAPNPFRFRPYGLQSTFAKEQNDG